MSDAVIVRAARLSELECLLDLEQKVISAERPFNANLKAAGVKYYDVEHLITDNDSCMLVAVIGSQIIGTGYAQIRPSKVSFDHDQHSYLGFMYVEPEARGKGVNKMVVQALIAWSEVRGIKHFYLDVYSNNEAAISAYRKMGFNESMIEMKLCIED